MRFIILLFTITIYLTCIPTIAEEKELGEKIPLGENVGIDGLKKAELAKIQQKGFPAQRGQHPKHHGCVKATFTVFENIPQNLKYGVFKEARTFDAFIRFSNGKEHDDTKPDAHGMAIKLVGVKGTKLMDDEKFTQDFVLVDNPVFFARDVLNLISFIQALREAKQGNPEALKPHQRSLQLLQSFLKRPGPNPLQARYWSVTPYKLGKLRVAVKYMVRPAVENKSGHPESKDALRSAMASYLETQTANFGFYIQQKPQDQPITTVEDPSIEWSEQSSEPIQVARITIKPQKFTFPDQLNFCENLSFSPWHALEDHKPLGGINRARRDVYIASSNLRHKINGVKPKEPKKGDMP